MEILSDKPRKLTEEEIQDVLSLVPSIKSAADTVSAANTKAMKVLLREQLQDIEITPLGLSDLKSEILRQFNETSIRPGTVVGVLSAESISKPITQMALNSFQTSGAAKNVSTGIERMTELINATQNPKKPSCSIYFKDTFLSFDDIIINKRPQITEITVKDCVIGIPDVENTSSIIEPYWYSLYRALVRSDFGAKDVLRLVIDPNILYAYKLTMYDIVSVIEKGQPVICVYSPMSEGRIDIYPIEKLIISKLKEMKIDIVSHENASLIFLSMVVVPALDKLKISGISGIAQIYPVEAGVWQIVKDEIPTADFENGWFLILNPARMRITGITVDKLIRLCEVLGMKVLKKRENYIAVSSVISPTKAFNDAIKKDNDEEKAYEKRKREEGARIIRRPLTEISKASKLIYADSTGANLKELLTNPDIDTTRTYSNDVHEIRASHGIEAARTFLIKEFIEVIGNEGYINPRHIVLLVDFMCSLGNVYGVTSTGISRQPISVLEKASFEKAMKHFKEATVFGEEKGVSGTSASVFIGKKALLGTGYSESYIRPEHLERYHETRRQLNAMPVSDPVGKATTSTGSTPSMVLDVSKFNDAIESFTVEAGSDVAFLTGAEEEMFGAASETPSIVFVAPNNILNSNNTVPTTITSTESQANTSESVILVKGKPVRSAELEEVASRLSGAACMKPSKVSPPIVTTLEDASISKALPESLLQEMERIASSGKPSLPSTLPPFGLPPLGSPSKLPSVLPPLGFSSKLPPLPSGLPPLKAKPATTFNLESFLG
jgi:hypothetical protein